MESAFNEIEPKLKEILYRYLEEIKATKAALYLRDDDDDFEVATQYGFRNGLRQRVGSKDELVDRILVKRAPFYLNSLSEDPRFSEILYDAGTSSLLVVPVYSRGKLIGFVDLRDKASKQPFETPDLTRAQKIADLFLELFAQKNLFGQRSPTLSNVRLPRLDQAAEPSRAQELIEQARSAIAHGALRQSLEARGLDDDSFEVAAALLPGILGLHNSVLASFAAFTAIGGIQRIVAHGEVRGDSIEHLQGRVVGWLQKRGEPTGPVRSEVDLPFGGGGAPVTPERLVSLLSAPVRVEGTTGLVLSVAFDVAPDAETKRQLERFLRDLERAVGIGLAASGLGRIHERITEKLVEPDFEEYTELMAHSRRVADLAERLASHLALSPRQVEHIRLAGLVHDVGMRLLDYSHLYRKQHFNADDLKILREHVVVGAAMIAESGLSAEIAEAVYTHHERFDGTGYPRGLSGDQIPLAARIVHLCESFDAMTAPDSYQQPIDTEVALAKLQRGAGAQFDPDLVQRFSLMMQ
ncbi:MAG TPA: HD domain-containing phosphohydrolase [Thermoanaerobaculia bacterium]|nr:HD domain-containing phosphohydrolase [Thermoanaerobaculia bacterium]